jgi:hypothetical protein
LLYGSPASGGTKANEEAVGRDLDFLAVHLRAVVADNVVTGCFRLHQFSGGTHRVEHREKILPEQGGKVAPAETDALTVVDCGNSMNYSRQTLKGYGVSFVLHRGETSTAPHLGQFLPRRFIHPHEQDTTISFLDATGPLHHHRNRYAVTGGALRHLLVDY